MPEYFQSTYLGASARVLGVLVEALGEFLGDVRGDGLGDIFGDILGDARGVTLRGDDALRGEAPGDVVLGEDFGEDLGDVRSLATGLPSSAPTAATTASATCFRLALLFCSLASRSAACNASTMAEARRDSFSCGGRCWLR